MSIENRRFIGFEARPATYRASDMAGGPIAVFSPALVLTPGWPNRHPWHKNSVEDRKLERDGMSEKLKPSRELMLRMRQAFLAYGYDGMSMVTLAKACGFTRRSLYNYFSHKEEAFRASIQFNNYDYVRAGMTAGEDVRRNGGSALDIIAEILDVRYGLTRRRINQSPHSIELNAEAFRRCRDIMIEAALDFQVQLEKLLIDLEREGMFQINADVTHEQLAQMLADGGRAVNQALPPIETEDYTGRYRAMCQAILYGSATLSTDRTERAAKKPGRSNR